MESEIVSQAKASAQEAGLPYAGDLTPQQAWQLVQNGKAVIVDVRTPEEYHLIGHVPDSQLVPWQSGSPAALNPLFVPEMERRFPKDAVLLLLCRGARRSVKAAIALKQAGFESALNILEGFEGKADDSGQRGHINGWMFHNLPWVR